MVKLRIISPHFTNESSEIAADLKNYIKSLQKDDLEVSYSTLVTGPSSIECELDRALATPGIVQEVARAENEGIDAAIISCFGDPGLAAAREATNIPVFGPGQTSMHVASLLGHKFSIVTVVESVRPMIENLARQYAVIDKLASIRVINIPVLNLLTDTSALHNALAVEAAAAVTEDRADVIVLGCTGFLGSAEAVTAQLRAQGIYVPVIDPAPVTIAIAQAICNLGLKHSERVYKFNASKPTKGYDSLAETLGNRQFK
ncbi:aspartate/glutamate racemase family protein [Aquirhabdus parva]|uniref:Hydrogenase expression protein HupH n=1 Tax=Aquirhabdus parva TaxID=2283318 RepID=A0A345P5M8_9GAMM|nr:aspartate/glutamate racemase family protein [Aquirhabdus parva]AXI02587.1 hydrogenase expression protein HupH [Aquirhabdus parva]